MAHLRFGYSSLSFEEVYSFLLETDAEFLAPLSLRVNLKSYARKLSEYSDFSLCYEEDQLVGMISCYTNQPPIGYISNVCVKKQYQGRGVFSTMFQGLLYNMESRGIHILRLEVDCQNDIAYGIYRHVGFQELEYRSDTDKVLMELVLEEFSVNE